MSVKIQAVTFARIKALAYESNMNLHESKLQENRIIMLTDNGVREVNDPKYRKIKFRKLLNLDKIDLSFS